MQEKIEGKEDTHEREELQDHKGFFMGKMVLFIVLAVFVLAFIIHSIINLNMSNIKSLNYPVSSNNQICNLVYPQSYPYLYIDLTFPHPYYRCVNQCPSGWNQFAIEDSTGQQIDSLSQEFASADFGGICWSDSKRQIMERRYGFGEFGSKVDLLHQFDCVIIIMAIAFAVSLVIMISELTWPGIQQFMINSSIAFAAIGMFIVVMLISTYRYRMPYIILASTLLLVFLIAVVCNLSKVREAVKYIEKTINRIQDTQYSSRALLVVLAVFNILNFGFMVLVLFQYLCIASSEALVKEEGQVFFTSGKTWWKYCLLLLEWMLISNVIQQIYTFTLVKLGYQMNRNLGLSFQCLTFEDVLNIVAFSFIQVLLWLPIKILNICKPNGAIIREKDDDSLSNRISRASYCCCGLLINKVHRYSFNPYLVLALDQEFHNLDSSLRIIQYNYHKHDQQYDKSSIWIHHFANQVQIIVFSISALVYLVEQTHSSPLHFLILNMLTLLLSSQVSHLNLSLFSTLFSVTEFMTINQS